MDDGPEEAEQGFQFGSVDEILASWQPEARAKKYLEEALRPPDPETSLYPPQSWLMPSGVPPAEFEIEIQNLTGAWRGGRPQDQLRRLAQYLDDHPEFDLIAIRQLFVTGPDQQNPSSGSERITWGTLGPPNQYPAPQPNPGPTPV